MSLTSNYCCKNVWVVFFVIAGVFSASVFLFPLFAKADEADFQAAISDLSSATDQNITTKEQALEFCNQEKYFDTCADIGKKHNLYTEEEKKQVDSFLSEVKGKILDDIKNCADETCLIKAAEELAKKIQSKNPTLATNFNITAKVIEEKKAVVEAAREVGINFRDCETMNPDTASIDLLRKCAKLAKDSRVQKYIPEERRALAEQFEDSATIKLREALVAGKYQCGDNTLEGCGNFCLNPAGAAKGAGISPVCAQIASEIFGADGVKQLEAAHQQVGQVKDYYSKKFILTLPNGKELAGEGQIRSACDQAFSSRNLEIARACGSFAVNNGFVSQAEVDKGLKLMESFAAKAQDFDFDKCLANPAACRDFIPSEDQERFDAGNQIFEIMKTEIGFDPSQCERGSVDEAIGTKCFEGSKRALSKIESLGLANKSREARFILEDIKRHVSEGEDFIHKKDQFKQVFSQQGGPGGCKSEAECFTYCSNSANGPECISFGAKHEVSGFQGQGAVQRFQEYNQNLQRPGLTSDEYRPYPPGGQYPQYPGQGPYPGFQPPGQGGFPPPGQIPGFNQPGPGFYPPPTGSFPGGDFNPPSPECLAALQSGDFARAKTACYVPPQPTRFPTPQICPASPYVECPAGQYHESFRNRDGCWIDGPCKTVPTYSPGPYPTYTYSPGPYPTYSPYPTFSPSGDPAIDCQKSGGTWDEGAHYCKYPYPTYSPYPTYTGGSSCSQSLINLLGSGCHQMYSDSTGKLIFCNGEMTKSAKEGDTATTAGCSSPGGTYSPYPSGSPYPTGGKPQCSDGLDNDNDGKTDYPADSSCYGADDWDEYYPTAEGTYSPYPSPSSCPAGYHYHGESGGFCMNDQENFGGTCYNSAGSSKITCPAQPSYTPVPSCPSGQSWNYSTNSCQTNTSSGTCPSGAHVMYVNNAGGYCMSDADSSKCGPLNSTSTSSFGSCTSYQGYTSSPYPSGSYTYTPAPSCPSGQWWDYSRNACVSSTTSYTPYPSCPSGQWWDPSISACKTTSPSDTPTGTYTYSPYPTSTYTYTPYPSCPSGQWWDSATSSCHTSTYTYTPYPTSTYTYTPPPSCPSDQYWNGTACVSSTTTTYTPYPTTEYTPAPTHSESPHAMVPSSYGHNIIVHCQQLGRTWNGKICQANGLFARFYENSGLANMLRLFYLVP